jgi:hypothetical protein
LDYVEVQAARVIVALTIIPKATDEPDSRRKKLIKKKHITRHSSRTLTRRLSSNVRLHMSRATSEAQALALALEAGAVPLAEVRAWADKQIEQVPTPGSELIDLALTKGVAEAIGLLHELGSGADTRASARLAFGHLQRALSRRGALKRR